MSATTPPPTSTSEPPSRIRILIINPNTSTHMTTGLEPLLTSLADPSISYTFFTSPQPGISSINSPDDAASSSDLCLPHILPLLADHDGFLVACYSQHPLVPALQAECAKYVAAHGGRRKYVTGIFEASVLSSLSLLLVSSAGGSGGGGGGEAFGIVTTGQIWEPALTSAVEEFLGVRGAASSSSLSSITKFAGVETTGVTATDLHDLPADQVQLKMKEATRRLLRKGKESGVPVRAVCLGCAGMAGLDDTVREACVEELGSEEGQSVYIVDGVKAGVGVLAGLVRAAF